MRKREGQRGTGGGREGTVNQYRSEECACKLGQECTCKIGK